LFGRAVITDFNFKVCVFSDLALAGLPSNLACCRIDARGRWSFFDAPGVFVAGVDVVNLGLVGGLFAAVRNGWRCSGDGGFVVDVFDVVDSPFLGGALFGCACIADFNLKVC
tara:strand:+ start:3010 stop:3345 length:336 start_codon:yes stop_codon:yes gene_type:complete